MRLDTLPSGMPFTDTIYVYMHGTARVFMGGVRVAIYIYLYMDTLYQAVHIQCNTHYHKCQLTR